MKPYCVPAALIGIGAGFAFYAICERDAWIFAFASILIVSAAYEWRQS